MLMQRDNKGFTLVELLVVVAIVAILASLLLPALQRGKGEGRRIRCVSNVRQILMATLSYASDDQAFPPFFDRSDSESFYWAYKIKPYIQANWTNKVFHCPGFSVTNVPAYLTPNLAVFPIGRGCYDINFWGTGPTAIDQMNGGTRGLGIGGSIIRNDPNIEIVIPTRESDVRVPAGMIALGDVSLDPLTFNNPFSYLEVMLYLDYYGENSPFPSDHLQTIRKPFDRRHNRTFNLAFADGHVESRPAERFFNYNSETLRMWNVDNIPRKHTN